MADALVSSLLEIFLGKLAEVLGRQIGLFAGAIRELEWIRDTFQFIKAYLRDAESKQVSEESVRLWLSKLKSIVHDIEDVLDQSQVSGLENHRSNNDIGHEVRTCLLSPYACFDRSVSRYKIARQIEEIRDKLARTVEEGKLFNFSRNTSLSGEPKPGSSRPQTFSLVEEAQIIGRDEDKETVIGRLVSGNSSGDVDGQVHVTAIVGIGGLGKTALAQQICQDRRVTDHFNQAIYWVCVSEVFDVIRLIKAIIQEVKKVSSTLSELNSLKDELVASLSGKRFLLVLDDVWNEEAQKWEPLRLSLQSGEPGSRILVTTRSANVANIMKAHIRQLEGLSDLHSWELFKNKAFDKWEAGEYSDPDWTKVGKQIVGKCRGVPLSIKVIGSAMNSKKEMADWQNISDSTMWSLPQVTGEILPALMLSYYNLPSYLKPCFAYCSVFRKDTEMEKNELVMLWVTQGFIQPQASRDLENIGAEYFNDLVARSMFQEVNYYWGKTSCKMHDLIHDLAEFLMKDESYIFPTERSNQCSIGIRHASLLSGKGNPSIPLSSFRAEKLRTLFVHGSDESDTILVDMFPQARFLRVLLFRQCKINKLPKAIGKLKNLRYLELSGWKGVELPNAFEEMQQLRYLDLSGSNIAELPDSVNHLVNLHTLKLNDCRKLKKLPTGIGRIVNLSHLQIEGTGSLECLPKGLGKISCLRSLCKFIVGGEEGCRIDELQHLNSLEGSLEIQHLERVSNEEEAEKAELWNKSHLSKLVLRMWSGWDVMSGRNDGERERMENVLDGLRPHRNLEELKLDCHSSGSKLKLPSWIEDSSFLKLTKLVIRGFNRCEENLLGLGKLPELKYLELIKVGVRKMGDEFYYGTSSNDVVGERRGVSFPKLESLSLKSMFKLKEWELASEADDAPKLMPYLRQLLIEELRVLPDSLGQLESLEQLTIKGCRELVSLPHSLGQLQKLKSLEIEAPGALTCLPDSLVQLKSLEELAIRWCWKLVSLPLSLGQLQKLKNLHIDHANALTCLPNSLGKLESLEQLTIDGCKKLVLLPQSFGQLKKLKSFTIEGAEVLTCLPDSLGQLESLEQLAIGGCQKLVSLPHTLGQLQKLKSLEIKNADALTCLPGSLGQLESLEELAIHWCRNLASLPHSLGQLQKLKNLHIDNANALTCLPDSLGQRESLKKLTIRWCIKLVSLPLGQLQKLKSLEIEAAGALTCLPESLGQMKLLEELAIRWCWELVSLPLSLGQLQKLKNLHIDHAEALTYLPDSLGQLKSLEQLTIEGCPKLVLLPDSFEQLKNLKSFKIQGAEALSCLPDSLRRLESLEELAISWCEKLVSLPLSLGQLQKLKNLHIDHAEALTCLPDSIGQLESLKELTITDCRKLVSLPPSLGQLKTLESLFLKAEALTCLPYSLGQLASLEDLRIYGCQKLVLLPYSLGQLKALRHLHIFNCKALKSLPPALQDLSLLQQLDISLCPLLEERCKRGGKDWPKISHILQIHLGFQQIK